jgi:lipoprotein-anchoring transpeptidase ErfK/SrfK
LKNLFRIILCLAGMHLPATTAQAEVVARVDISAQTLTLIEDGITRYVWPVSTARAGKVTPKGTYTAEFWSRYHKSSRYNNAPMPYSIFYSGNFAVHGTDQISKLGQPASSGCVRLHPDNAAILFAMSRAVGLDQTIIEIVN